MIAVILGNVAPHDTLDEDLTKIFGEMTDEQLADNNLRRYGDLIIRDRNDIGNTTTEVQHPYDDPLECVTNIKSLWAQHSTSNPAWVWSSDPIVATLIKRSYPGCVIASDSTGPTEYELAENK